MSFYFAILTPSRISPKSPSNDEVSREKWSLGKIQKYNENGVGVKMTKLMRFVK